MVRTKKTKEEFIKDCENRIALREELVRIYNEVYLPTLKKFDGKVYNIRFIKALRESLKDNPLVYVTEAQSVNNKDNYLYISHRVNQWSYTDKEEMCVKLMLNDEYRIDYDATIESKLGKAWIENFINNTNDYRTAIKEYDNYMVVAKALEAQIEEFNNLPYMFRRNVDNYWYIAK